MNSTVIGCVIGLGTAVGLLLVLVGLQLARPATGRSAGRELPWRADRRWGFRVALAAGIGLLAAAATGWLVGGVLAFAAVWFLPALVGPDRVHARRVARIEAVASWTEMLRDTLSAAAGLEQAILATAPLAPAAIRRDVAGLAARLRSGHRLAPALRLLADEIGDPIADLVIASLVLAAEHQARQLGELLGSLAETARAQAAMRMRVETGRARTRTSVRVIVGTTIAFAVGVVVLNRDYLTAYDSPLGQAVLLCIGALFGSGFAWLARIVAGRTEPRALSIHQHPEPEPVTAAAWGGERA
ncbi:type II secretion system F family protein [Amycolatopsis sp. FBCC-B4732]|uniref:type II secretion system F family protein n=1 Tax=Amycolatopsis sp. FBCC-B4732 TaxID=3079339 RepID=UPI001FF2E06F|nr:type II secretion system F family protein [Amycolatopsis sp. FBCC-B4732]UOX88401.1 type II secretion system F family protein [Amycolatopsis sp. FBCC-B4732]